MADWDAKQYLKFASERTRPAHDLVARIEVEHPRRIADIGCGPGNSTAILRQRWPDADVTGIDSSAEMIDHAKRDHPQSRWIEADATAWQPDDAFDVVFSNAALHWMPDHRRLFARLMRFVRPGGALAVQMPYHYESPLHAVVFETARAEPWRSRMRAARAALTHETAPVYYDILAPLAPRIDVWQTTYVHILDDHRALLEWVRGTSLRPFLDVLRGEEERTRFEQMVLDGFTKAFPAQEDGKVLLPFPRLFIVAYA